MFLDKRDYIEHYYSQCTCVHMAPKRN